MSPRDLTGIIVNTANIIFDQNWEMEDSVHVDDNHCEMQSDISDESDEDEPQQHDDASTTKRRTSAKDLTYVYISKSTHYEPVLRGCFLFEPPNGCRTHFR